MTSRFATNATQAHEHNNYLELDEDGLPVDGQVGLTYQYYIGPGDEIITMDGSNVIVIESTLSAGPLIIQTGGYADNVNLYGRAITITTTMVPVNNIVIDYGNGDIYAIGSSLSSNIYSIMPTGAIIAAKIVFTDINEAVLEVSTGAGTQGPQGPPGVDGVDGVDGVNGTNGVDGQDGVDGINGTNGVDGTNGTNGVDGQAGVDGTNGTNGVDGIDGAVGPPGPAFTEGYRGSMATIVPSGTSTVLDYNLTPAAGGFGSGWVSGFIPGYVLPSAGRYCVVATASYAFNTTHSNVQAELYITKSGTRLHTDYNVYPSNINDNMSFICSCIFEGTANELISVVFDTGITSAGHIIYGNDFSNFNIQRIA